MGVGVGVGKGVGETESEKILECWRSLQNPEQLGLLSWEQTLKLLGTQAPLKVTSIVNKGP